MEMIKSSRHSKITGDFSERLILYWLSKYGFECAYVDHVGIDILARQPNSNELWGISVKSRSRYSGTEKVGVSIPNDHFPKLTDACNTFNCIPYFAVVVDTPDSLWAFILSQETLLRHHSKGKSVLDWKMGPTYIDRYLGDPQIRTVRFSTEVNNLAH